ncbi:MAG: hypothetical protein IT168_19485 [Bryobacterales bacterium]|nr:hypothetical protein [Bryobacterales bacterium]
MAATPSLTPPRKNLDISVNFLISQYAKIGYQTALEESVRNEPNYNCVKR